MKTRRITKSQLYTFVGLICVLAIVTLDKGCVLQPNFSSPTDGVAPGGFVTRSGSQLLLNGQPFRFAGANMHWLALDDSTNYPSQFRVNDGLDAAREMGLTVVRSHSLGASTGCRNCIEPSLGVFNETALAHVDYAIKAARDHDIRLIIPLTDNWHFPAGGKHNFTDWRGISDENQFYYNSQVIQDFETYIRTLLNHVNIYTGIVYKNDPTILAWETGNELQPPASWTQTISAYIKSLDPNHLVVDGEHGVDPHAVNLGDIDIVSNHYYPKSIAQLKHDASAAQRAGKVFFVGEFDWNDANGGDTLSDFLSTIESDAAIAGDALWELWSHDDEYAYVAGGDRQYTLHYPGDSAAMRASVQQLRKHAYQMRQASVPSVSIPGVPSIDVVIRDGSHNVLVWRGTALAASYTIERSTSGTNGPWTVICDRCATDLSTPWIDTTTPAGALWYRVTAYNLTGVAGRPSSPYRAGSGRIITDQLNDWSQSYEHSSNLAIDTSNSQYMHGDPARVIRTTASHESITWRQAGMTSFQAIAYFWPNEAVSPFSLYTSADGSNWTLFKPLMSRIGGDWLEYIYTLDGLENVNYVKMVWNNTDGQAWSPQLGEVTIFY